MTLDQIKNNALVYILLPMRIGLSKAVLPFTWGFSFPEHIQNIYLISVVVISSIMILRGKKSLGFMILGFGLVAYRGFTFLPWVAVVVFITWLCYRFQVLNSPLQLFYDAGDDMGRALARCYVLSLSLHRFCPCLCCYWMSTRHMGGQVCDSFKNHASN